MTESTDMPTAAKPQRHAIQWDEEHATKTLGQRTAGEEARFILDFLRPGMSLLDCGCGPGSITLGLAALVAPGEVCGIDLTPKLIEQAKAAAAEQGVANVRFEVANAQELPFDDDTFDVVFSHALVEHLSEPEVALAQMKRVLKPGGILAIRTPNWAGNLLYPDENNLHQRITSGMEQIAAHNGSDPYCSRRLGSMLVSQGFADVRLTASYTSYGTPEKIAELVKFMRGFEWFKPLLDSGWITQAEIDQLKADFNAWAQVPGAFHMRAWIEAVARKP